MWDFYALESYLDPGLVFGTCEFSAQLVQKTAASRTVYTSSAELNASCLVTANILNFMKRSSLSSPLKQINCQTLGARAEKNPKLERCSVWPLLPCQPGEQITKNPLEKPVIVRSLGSCVLLTALKWIALLLLLLKRGRPGARMDSTYVLIRGTAKWDPSVGLKHGLLLKCISAERATRTFLVVFFFLFMALSWKMKTNFPYFSSLHCFDRLLSLESWNSSVLLYIDVYLPSLVRINNFSNSRGLKAL